MESVPETGLWVICPVCLQPNPKGTKYCKNCWGAALHSGCVELPSDGIEPWLSRVKHRKKVKLVAFSLFILAILVSIVLAGLYYLTDILTVPPQAVTSTSIAGEWSMFRHDLNHSGTDGQSGILPQGTVKWAFSTGGPIHSSPALVDGTVYVGSQDYRLYAIDAATGDEQWQYTTGSWVQSSPSIVKDVVYFGSNDGNLYALSASSGRKLWNFKVKYPIMSSPAVADGIVYFGAEDYNLYAVDAELGTKMWQFETGGYVTASPAVANGIVYSGSGSNFFYALHAKNGRLRMHFQTHYPSVSSPAINGQTIYFTTANGFLYSVNGNARTWPREHQIKPFWIQAWAFGVPGIPKPPPQSGLLWYNRVDKVATSSPTITDDTLYIGSGNKLLAIDLETRESRWQFETGGTIRSTPAVVDNTVYVGSEDGRLYAVDATSGEKRWDVLTGGKITSSPAVINGTVYIGSHDGNLYAIE